jgi:hypothetical protein
MGKDLLSTLRWLRPNATMAAHVSFAAPPMVLSTDPTTRMIQSIGFPVVPAWPDVTKCTAKEQAIDLLRAASQVEQGLQPLPGGPVRGDFFRDLKGSYALRADHLGHGQNGR